MSKIKILNSIIKGDYMKISDIVSKSVIDDCIMKSENVETLCALVVTAVVSVIVANIFSKEKGGNDKI